MRVRFPPWAPFKLYFMKKHLPPISLRMRKGFIGTLLIVVAVILVWRGLWNLMDIYIFPENELLSNIASVAIGLFLLYLPDQDLKELS